MYLTRQVLSLDHGVRGALVAFRELLFTKGLLSAGAGPDFSGALLGMNEDATNTSNWCGLGEVLYRTWAGTQTFLTIYVWW